MISFQFLALVTVYKQLKLNVFSSVFSEEYPPIREEDALAKWASDPANTAWMESKNYKNHIVVSE